MSAPSDDAPICPSNSPANAPPAVMTLKPPPSQLAEDAASTGTLTGVVTCTSETIAPANARAARRCGTGRRWVLSIEAPPYFVVGRRPALRSEREDRRRADRRWGRREVYKRN